MKKIKITIICLFLGSFNLIAQDSIQVPRVVDKLTFGLGVGFDYGAIGSNMLVYPHQNIGLFGGVGYALGGLDYCAGAKFRLISKKDLADPFAVIMYGYNAAIKVTNASQYDKLFYGPSFGIGMDFRSKRMTRGYWSFTVMVPFRSSAVNEYMDDLNNNHGIKIQTGLLPIAFSLGYRLISK